MRFIVVFTILRSASSVRTSGETLKEIWQIYFELDAFSRGKSQNGASLSHPSGYMKNFIKFFFERNSTFIEYFFNTKSMKT